MKLVWAHRARQDLKEIGSFIAHDKPGAARSWVERLRARARDAARIPSAGRVVPEFARQDVRELLLGNYRIVYCVGEAAVTVLCVFEGHRLLRSDDIEGAT